MTILKLYQVVNPHMPFWRNPHAFKKEVVVAINDKLIGNPGHSSKNTHINYHNLYINNGHTDVCLLVCLSVGMWRVNGNPNPCTDLNEFCTHIPNWPRKVLVQV